MFIKPGDKEWKQTQAANQARLEKAVEAKEKATESQWQMIDFAINAWISAYPKHWFKFQQELMAGRNTYNDAKEGGLKQTQWRNTAAFPIAYVPDPVTGEMQSKSLLQVLKKIIPHLTHKNSANYIEFLKRYPSFMPSEKTNASNYNQAAPIYTPPTPKIPTKEEPVVIKKKGRKKTNAKD